MRVSLMQRGTKAEGLRVIPQSWTPDYIIVPPEVLMSPTEDINEIVADAITAFSGRPVIVRSNAALETLVDRGRFRSVALMKWQARELKEALFDLRNQGLSSKVAMGAIIQLYKAPTMTGHFSNEYRVSKTRNHWQVETEYPTFSDFRVNSQRDTPPMISKVISLRHAALPRALGSLGNWAARTFSSRVHIEWVLEADKLWIVQLDFEDQVPDRGVDPRSFLDLRRQFPLETVTPTNSKSYLEPWAADTFPQYRKLHYVASFQEVVRGRFPQLFVLRGENVEEFLSDASADFMKAQIGERLVWRTDLDPAARSRFDGLNLPRTDTLSPTKIYAWIAAQFPQFLEQGVSSRDIVFIIHAFIPSVSSAWAEATPGDPLVLVDALWGLPDGLQYLEHDRFEWDTKSSNISAEHITYKYSFLHEASDGTWTIQSVNRSVARTASISRNDVAFISKATLELAERFGIKLRVMWFVGTHGSSQIAQSIPWFCHQPEEGAVEDGSIETAQNHALGDRSSFRRLERIDIRTPEDLITIPNTPRRLRLIPTPEHMRNNDFIEEFAEKAKSGGHTIEMMGSGLGHAYYIMARSGAPIVVPSQRGYTRVRKLRTFGKLVRDRIPEKITSGGEAVISAVVPKEDRRRWLLAKLLEEAQEVSETTNEDDLRNELADLFEVVRSLAKNEGLPWEHVVQTAIGKADRLGAFDDGTVLLRTTAAKRSYIRNSRGAEASVARIVKDGETTIIPHLALLADSVDLPIGGSDLRVSYSTDGVVIQVLGPETDDGQLRLAL